MYMPTEGPRYRYEAPMSPLAVLLNNQGLAKREFRAALGLIRLAESSLTAIAYAATGLLTRPALSLLPSILPGVALGVPMGAFVIRHVHPETFRRLCMSFDAWVVAFGLSAVVRQIGWTEGKSSYSILAAVALIDAGLLYRFFRQPRAPALSDRPDIKGRHHHDRNAPTA